MMHLWKPPSFGILGTCKGQAWGSKGFVLQEISGSARGKKKEGSDTKQNNGGGRLITQAKVWL
jgi:hypothetical protein